MSGEATWKGSVPESMPKSAIWNIAGQLAPLLVALITIPFLIRALGLERFGLLTIAWMIIGYLSLFDLGIGRATTKFAAEHISAGNVAPVQRLLWVSGVLLFGIGTIVGLLLVLISGWLLVEVFPVSPGLTGEAKAMIYWVSAGLPFVLMTSGIRGILEARQRFSLVNKIRIPGNAATFLAPLLVTVWSSDLGIVTAVLVISRVIVFLAFAACVRDQHLHRKERGIPRKEEIVPLVKFGGWLTVTNAIGTLMSMAYLDRLIVSSLLGVEALTYYATPFEVMTKLWVIPAGLIGVLFPAFVTRKLDNSGLSVIHWRAVKFVVFAVLPPVLVGIILAEPLISWWLGNELAGHMSTVLKYVAVGVLCNSLAHIPFVAVQAVGRPDLTAKRHIAELPIYLPMLYLLTKAWGVDGAAFAWMLWAMTDMLVMFWIMAKLLPIWRDWRTQRIAALAIMAAMMIILALLSSMLSSVPIKMALAIVIIIVMFCVGWRFFIDADERAYVRSVLRFGDVVWSTK